jgi:UDP-N-acetylglucosamine transferase subunit ALG13
MSTKAQIRLINRYSEVWVPDHQEDRLSGYLSDISPKCPKRYIGPLSRFVSDNDSHNKYDIAVILSGPEPARANLEEKLMEILKDYIDLRIVLVRGTPKSPSYIKSGDQSIEVKHLIDTKTLQEIILSSSTIISRSGYSTIMDLHTLDKKAILIPTPNQPEQEYLATYHDHGDQFLQLAQSDLNPISLRKAIMRLEGPSK